MVDWHAKWIWAKSHLTTPNVYLYARREIQIGSFSEAAVRVTCRSDYRLYINGRYIGRGPGPCPPSVQYYDEYDVTHVLRPGKNVLAAICHNSGAATCSHRPSPGGFLLQLEIKSPDQIQDGSDGVQHGPGPTIVTTDAAWRVKLADDWNFRSARMAPTLGFQEVYDSRRKPVGWNVVGFDDSGWEQPAIVRGAASQPERQLVPRPIPPLREREVFPANVLSTGVVSALDEPGLDVATRMYREAKQPDPSVIRYPNSLLNAAAEMAIVEAGRDAYMVIDFDREVVGFPMLRVRDGGHGVIDLGYSDALDEDGHVNPIRQSVLQADRLILHGGRQEWQTFGRRAFRYMQITFRELDAPLYIDRVSVNSVGYPVERVCSFECSDEVLNKAWQKGAHMLSLCMQDTYEDDPLRPSSQHPEHTRLQALMNYYSFCDTGLAHKAIREFALLQEHDGCRNSTASGTSPHELSRDLAWVLLLHDYYLYTGDRSVVGETYPHLQRLVKDALRTAQDDDDVLPSASGIGCVFYYQALRCAARLASALGEIEDAIEWHDRAEAAFRAFNKRFWLEQAECYADGSDSVVISALAVLLGLADSYRAELTSRTLGRAARDSRSDSGFPYTFYLIQALGRLGMEQEALDLIRRYCEETPHRRAPASSETIDRFPTECCNCPDGFGAITLGAATYFLPAEILGVKPSMPESEVVMIQPRTGDLHWARGTVAAAGTPARSVEVEWRAEPERFTIDIDAPGGFVAALPVGRFSNPQIEEIDMSPETPERRARSTYGWGNVIWRDGEEHDPYLDWLRSQEEEPPPSYAFRRRCSMEGGYVWVRECALTQVRYIIQEVRSR